MTRHTMLGMMRARYEELAREKTADLVEALLRQGYDEDAIADFIGTAIAHNKAAVETALAETAAILDSNGIHAVRSLTFSEPQPDAPRLH